MKKSLIAFCFVSAVFAGFSLFAQAGSDVKRKASLDSSYINTSTAANYKEWTGGYAPEEINTAQQIKDIGIRLGKGITYQENVQDEALPYNKGNPAYKYSSARIYGQNKRGADVLLIGQSATVDTVKCLKLIIRGYLENAFGCSEASAKILAEEICYWNTNNYGNKDFFNSSFEAGVTDVFAGRYKNIGLPENYRDWKQSIIIIPHEFTKSAEAYVEPVYEPEPEPQVYQPEPEVKTVAQDISVDNNRQSKKVDKKSGLSGVLIGVIAVLALIVIGAVIVIILKKNSDNNSL